MAASRLIEKYKTTSLIVDGMAYELVSSNGQVRNTTPNIYVLEYGLTLILKV